jgi:Fe-S-cluster containining protein
MIEPSELKGKREQLRKEDQQLFKQLKKMPDRKLDTIVHDAHHEAFQKIDCLDCANCCKTTGPLFIEKDIARLAKHLKMKEKHFIESYLRIDEDGDYVLQTVPCPFLDADNYCGVYDKRPRACRAYPHTDRVKQKQILKLMKRNSAVCPAVDFVLDQIRNKLP